VQVLDGQHDVLAQQTGVVDVRGSLRSVYGLFGLGVAFLTVLSLVGALMGLARQRLPDNRWRRGLRFLTPGLGFGLVINFTLSALRVFVPDTGRWLVIVAACALISFALGYLTPDPYLEDADYDEDAPTQAVDVVWEESSAPRTAVAASPPRRPPPPAAAVARPPLIPGVGRAAGRPAAAADPADRRSPPRTGAPPYVEPNRPTPPEDPTEVSPRREVAAPAGSTPIAGPQRPRVAAPTALAAGPQRPSAAAPTVPAAGPQRLDVATPAAPTAPAAGPQRVDGAAPAPTAPAISAISEVPVATEPPLPIRSVIPPLPPSFSTLPDEPRRSPATPPAGDSSEPTGDTE